MRLIKYLICLFFIVVSVNSAVSQVIRFKSYRASVGRTTPQTKGLYAWGPWEMNNTEITIDLTEEVIDDSNGNQYKIFNKPKKWIIKKDFKYVSFECADSNFDKINVKLYQYDSGEFRLSIMAIDQATRYSVVYLDQISQENKDEILNK